jgi:hypothetical protein
MLNLSAQLNALSLQANSQEVQIQLAAQQVDQERSKLANLMSQVGSLLNQWFRSAQLASEDQQFTSDLLPIRDASIAQADDSFSLAQEWCFLAALALNYKDNCPNAVSYVPAVLAARNSASLQIVLNEMQSENGNLPLACSGSPNFQAAQFSLRNNFFQANQTSGSGSNTTVTSYQPVLIGGLVLTNAAGSQTAWTNYLAANVITNHVGQRVLLLNFGTTLAAEWSGGVQRNPLFNCYLAGTTLYSGLDNNGIQWRGVQVSFTTGGFTFPLGSGAGFKIGLAQLGTSSIRNRGYGNSSSSSPGYRYFNFGSYAVAMTASANDLLGNGGTTAFQERSPANSQWQLSINEADSQNNQALFNNLSQITDIQLQFNMYDFVDQTAYTHCNN